LETDSHIWKQIETERNRLNIEKQEAVRNIRRQIETDKNKNKNIEMR